MKTHEISIESIVLTNFLLRIVKFFLLIILFAFSTNIFSQSITKGIGNTADEYVYDMVSHNGINYLLSDANAYPDSMLFVGYNKIKLNCRAPAVIAFDDSLNIINYYCIETISNHPASIYNPGKIVYDSGTNSIYIAAAYNNNLVFGSDTLFSTNTSSIIIARFDMNLNPVWARSSNCNHPANFLEIKVDGMETDISGKLWVSIQLEGTSSRGCFNNDTIIDNGSLIIDSNGVMVKSNSHIQGPANSYNHSMKMIDDAKLLNIYLNTMTLVDSDMDTIIWQKNIPSSINQRYITTDHKNYFYIIENTNFDQLKKYDFNGNLIWQKSISNIKVPLGLDVNDDSNKIYLSGYSTDSLHTIYVVDSNGNFLESKVWAQDPRFGNSTLIENKTFKINNNKLILTFEVSSRELFFGKDTLNYSSSRRADIYISIIDINTILTNIPNNRSSSIPFNVFPIPSNNFVNIEGNQKIDAVKMYNLEGKLIKIKSSDFFKTIYFPNNLNKGVYFLKIYSESQEFVVKIIK